MAKFDLDTFMNLHRAVKSKNRLDESVDAAGECSRTVIEDYLGDELTSEEALACEAHLEKCESCREILREMKDFGDTFGRNLDLGKKTGKKQIQKATARKEKRKSAQENRL